MERCPSCGAALPAVAHFCPICGVKLPASEEAAPAAPDPAPQPAPHAAAEWRVKPVTGQEMLAPAFWAGIAAGVLVGVPGFDQLAGMWMLGCGILAVYFFRKQYDRPALPNEAARLGLLSGFFGFIVALAVAFLSLALIRRHPLALVAYHRENLERSAKMMRPDMQAQITEVLNTPGGVAVLLGFLATVYFFSFLAFSTLGSLVAGALSRRRQR